VPIQLAQRRFPGLAISNAKILINFFNKIYGRNFIKQYSETVMVSNCQTSDCSLRKKHCVIYYNFRHPFVLYTQGDRDAISMPAGFRCHLVAKPLINGFHCDIAEMRFVGDHTDIFINQRV